MKFMFALVALLHLVQVLVQCNSTYQELISRLDKLHKLDKNKINMTSPDLQVPTNEMQNNAECCVSVFKKRLLEVVNNVTVPQQKQHLIDEVKDLLDSVQTNGTEVNKKCKVKKPSGTLFKPYNIYLKKLNDRRKRSPENKCSV